MFPPPPQPAGPTLLSGSPFKNTVDLMIGTAGSHFIDGGHRLPSFLREQSTGAIRSRWRRSTRSSTSVRNAALPMGDDRPYWHRRFTSDWKGQRQRSVRACRPCPHGRHLFHGDSQTGILPSRADRSVQCPGASSETRGRRALEPGAPVACRGRSRSPPRGCWSHIPACFLRRTRRKARTDAG